MSDTTQPRSRGMELLDEYRRVIARKGRAHELAAAREPLSAYLLALEWVAEETRRFGNVIRKGEGAAAEWLEVVDALAALDSLSGPRT